VCPCLDFDAALSAAAAGCSDGMVSESTANEGRLGAGGRQERAENKSGLERRPPKDHYNDRLDLKRCNRPLPWLPSPARLRLVDLPSCPTTPVYADAPASDISSRFSPCNGDCVPRPRHVFSLQAQSASGLDIIQHPLSRVIYGAQRYTCDMLYSPPAAKMKSQYNMQSDHRSSCTPQNSH
jgi:hypothetical protein